jgi:hypothetical protein
LLHISTNWFTFKLWQRHLKCFVSSIITPFTLFHNWCIYRKTGVGNCIFYSDDEFLPNFFWPIAYRKFDILVNVALRCIFQIIYSQLEWSHLFARFDQNENTTVFLLLDVVAWIISISTAFKRTEEASYLKIYCFVKVILYLSPLIYIPNFLETVVMLSDVF